MADVNFEKPTVYKITPNQSYTVRFSQIKYTSVGTKNKK